MKAQLILDSLEVGEEALRARYETDPELELTVRHLLVFSARFETEETRARAREKAESALARIRAGEPFPQVAAEVSEEPGAESREGLLQPGREGSWVSEFWNAALALPEGGVSPVVETQYGFHVLRLEARETVPFEEARNQVLLDAVDMLGSGGRGPAVEALPGFSLGDQDTLAERVALGTPEGDTVAAWDGGVLTLGQLMDHLVTLEAREYETLDDPARPSSLESAVVDAAVSVDSERRAVDRGLAVDPVYDAELRRRWSDTWGAWAQTLGFAAGVGVEEVKQEALRALTTTGQNASLARDAVHTRSPLLHRAYPVRAGR